MKRSVLLLLVAATVGHAQVRFVMTGADSVRRPVDPLTVPALQRRVTLDLREVSRDVALVEIGRVAGLNVVYTADLVPASQAVTPVAGAMTVSAALEHALDGVSVDVVVGDDNTVTLRSRADAPTAIDGVVIDSLRRTPVRLAAVRLVGRSETVLTDDAGRFHVAAGPGPVSLDVRRIGFSPAALRVVASHGPRTINIALAPGALHLQPVVVRASLPDDPVADEIGHRVMRAALDRRARIRSSIHSYRFDAHARLLEGDAASLDAADVVITRESVLKGYWEAPGREQQTIVGQRKTTRYPYDKIYYTVQRLRQVALPSFEADSWAVLGVPAIPLPSPIATNALDHYRFTVLDTTVVDGRRAFRLALRARSNRVLAFDGIVDIADSTFDILDLRVGLGASVDDDFALDNLQLQLRFADVGGGRWMPVAMSTSLHGLAVSFIATAAEYTAAIGDYRFDVSDRPSGVGVFELVVSPDATAASTAVYAEAPALPPLPVAIGMPAASGGPAPADSATDVVAWNKQDDHRFDLSAFSDIRFNRVDGWTYAAAGTWEPLRFSPALTPTLRLGHEFGSKRTTYRIGDVAVLSAARRLTASAGYHDETLTPEAFAAPDYNPTVAALIGGPGADALQYFRERGLDGSVTAGLVGMTQLSIGYRDVRQSSVSVLDQYTRDGGRFGFTPTPNRPIDDGRLRSISATVGYDSRPLVLESHRFERVSANDMAGFASAGSYTSASLQAEVSDPSIAGGDFNYRRYVARIERRQETWMLGTSELLALAGTSDGRLPLQRLFLANGGSALPSVDAPFATMSNSFFGGTRAAAVVARHEFDRPAVKASRVPVLRELPVSFAVSLATLWASSSRGVPVQAAPSGYTELGVTAAYDLPVKYAPGITRWFLPRSVAVQFSSQLSQYDTRPNRLTIGIR